MTSLTAREIGHALSPTEVLKTVKEAVGDLKVANTEEIVRLTAANPENPRLKALALQNIALGAILDGDIKINVSH